MTFERDATLAEKLAHDVYGCDADELALEPVLELAASARFVMIGEASHGTHELYRARAELTQRLIVEHGFNVLAVEGDWSDAYRVNRFVRGLGDDGSAIDALTDFGRFPSWLWRNMEVVAFLEWLRAHNLSVSEPRRTGVYGMDLYGLHRSLGDMLSQLDERDPELAALARTRYGCFEAFGKDALRAGANPHQSELMSRESAVVATLCEEHERRAELRRHAGFAASDAFLYAEQSARMERDCESYYRTLYRGGTASWNLRERHMADTLDALDRHLSQPKHPAKVIVWAHNAHVGDARATEMHDHGELNIGQLMRERHPGQTLSVGFSTHTGSVMAAQDWSAPGRRMRVNEALPDSWESLFHAVGAPAFTLIPRRAAAQTMLADPRLQRAIGVIYRPDNERQSHYYHTRLSRQFDALIHIDETSAVQPVEQRAEAKLEHAEPAPSGV